MIESSISNVAGAIALAGDWLRTASGDVPASKVSARILGLEAADGLASLSGTERASLASALHAELDFLATDAGARLEAGAGLGLCTRADIALHALDALCRTSSDADADALRDATAVASRLARSLDRPLAELQELSGRALATAAGAALTALVHAARVDNQATALGAYHAILDHLEGEQDALTGCWSRLQEDPLETLLMTAARVLPFFFHVHRPVIRLARLTDFVLHHPHSAIRAEAGSEWSDLAATWLLTGMLTCDYRVDEIRAVLVESCKRLVALQSKDGSFEPAMKGSIGERAADWNAARDRLQATWLRVLALRTLGWAVSKDRSGCDSRFRQWPGPGCRPRGGALSAEARCTFDMWNRPIPRPIEHADPRVTVVIPCYNIGAFLPEAIASVEQQTLHEREVIIVDDGSTDDVTLLMLDAYERAGYPVLRQQNGGVASARNAGIRAARAPYISCLDPDDRLTPDFLRAAAAVLDEQPDVAIVSGDLQFFDGMDDTRRSRHTALPELLVHNGIVEPAIFRRSVWEDVGGYRGGFSVTGVEDWDFWLCIVERGHRVVALPEIVWEYRIQPGQMSAVMFRPENWGHAYRELADRHIETVRRYLPQTMEGLSEHWAITNAWARDQARGSEWWQREAAAQRERITGFAEREASMRAWIADLEQARDWERGQAANWERNYLEMKAVADERARWIAELEAAREWHRTQIDNWRREAEAWHRMANERAAHIEALESLLREQVTSAGCEGSGLDGVGVRPLDESASA